MKVGFIGAGVIGTALGILLKNKGYSIGGYYNRSLDQAQVSAKLVGTDYHHSMFSLCSAVDVVFITTNDDSIFEVARDLAEQKAITSKHSVIHCSGSLDLTVLNPVKELGADVLSIHPLQACASVEKAVRAISGSVFSIEGGEKQRLLGKGFVEALDGQYFYIEGQNKVLYHAAAVMASNYLVVLLDLSRQMMTEAGLPHERFYDAILPLVEGTLQNIRQLDTPQALTGPVSRGDINTIKDHILAIKKHLPDCYDAYRVLTKKAVPLALAKETLDQRSAQMIYDLLEKGTRDEDTKNNCRNS